VIPPVYRPLLREYRSNVVSLDWSPDGGSLLVCCTDGTVEVWHPGGRVVSRRLTSSPGTAACWRPDGAEIAVAAGPDVLVLAALDLSERSEPQAFGSKVRALAWLGGDGTLAVAVDTSLFTLAPDGRRTALDRTLRGQASAVAPSPDGSRLAIGAGYSFLVVRQDQPRARRHFDVHRGTVTGLAWSPDSRVLASASMDGTLTIRHIDRELTGRALEGHTDEVRSVAFALDGKVLASRSWDGTLRLWDTGSWDLLAVSVLDADGGEQQVHNPIAVHPGGRLLAVTTEDDKVVRVVDLPATLAAARPVERSVHHVTAKVVLLGDSGVGKTALGWRLAHGDFRAHPSTHGQQFWALDAVRTTRADGAECEAVLWDLAGQPDYRLVHALFLDDADLALVLFDPASPDEPLRGVEFWLKALAAQDRPARVVLVGARTDRGDLTLAAAEVAAFCRDNGIAAYVGTSAVSGTGIDDLVDRVRSLVGWDGMTATTTTTTFKRIKDLVLGLKESPDRPLFTDLGDLRDRLVTADPDHPPTPAEVAGAVGHLAKHGYVLVLPRSTGERVVLLAPELMNNLAASFVLEARRNPRGLGAIDENEALLGRYPFPELAGLTPADAAVLLDAVTTRFLAANICFRERNGGRVLLVFPALINLKRPATPRVATVEFVSYVVTGAVENVYAALVVLLGYTSVFGRSAQWQNAAEYEVDTGEVCAFQQVVEAEGQIQLALSAGRDTPAETRQLFQALVEKFLARRSVRVERIPAVTCQACGYLQGRPEVVRRLLRGFLFCADCGTRIDLPRGAGPEDRTSVEAAAQQAAAAVRTTFETALVQVKALARTRPAAPTCFVSYAWGDRTDEHWVETRLARDLRNAGIEVILDRWTNGRLGEDVARFVSSGDRADSILVVGTPAYLAKYENEVSATGSVVAAEIDLVNQRMLGSEERKRTVLPVLRVGTAETSLPPLLRGRTRGDMTTEERYLPALFDLLVSLYDLSYENPVLAELRRELRG
jgi:small GTP-binding protein